MILPSCVPLDLVVILGYTAQAVVPGLFDFLKMAGEEVLATTGHG